MADWSKGTDSARVGCGALMMLSWCSGAQTVPRNYPHIVTPPPSYLCNDQLLLWGRMDPCFCLFAPNSDSNPNHETLFHRLLSSFGEPVWIVAPVLLWHQQDFLQESRCSLDFYVNHSCLGKSSRSAARLHYPAKASMSCSHMIGWLHICGNAKISNGFPNKVYKWARW